MTQYEVFELTYTAPAPVGSHVDVDLTAIFTCSDTQTKVTGFYTGNGTYMVRFLPLCPGQYHYEVNGIVCDCGDIFCEAADADRHGPVYADGTHFKYADGRWFHPFGTTVYALVHQNADLIGQTLQTLESSPFNKVRMCVFPKHYDYNHNEPPFYAFEKDADGNWDPSHPCFAYWEHLEKNIRLLDRMGVQADLIVFHPYDRWGFSRLPVEKAYVYLDYLTRRLSAFPNLWWSLANEYELLASYEYTHWEGFAAFIHSHDPYSHLLSNHNIFRFWDFSNPDTSHICVQSSEILKVAGLIQQYQKPMMVDECRYDVEVIDIWEMIRTTVLQNVTGKVDVPMPGKEGIALLATKLS